MSATCPHGEIPDGANCLDCLTERVAKLERVAEAARPMLNVTIWGSDKSKLREALEALDAKEWT